MRQLTQKQQSNFHNQSNFYKHRVWYLTGRVTLPTVFCCTLIPTPVGEGACSTEKVEARELSRFYQQYTETSDNSLSWTHPAAGGTIESRLLS